MFNQISELNKMRQQAKRLQDQLSQIVLTFEEKGIKVKVTGDQKIKYLEIGGEEKKDVTEAINKAMKKVQKIAAKKMIETGGGLSGLLSGLK